MMVKQFISQKHKNVFTLCKAPKQNKNAFLRPYKISMILAAKHQKKSHFDSLMLLVKVILIFMLIKKNIYPKITKIDFDFSGQKSPNLDFNLIKIHIYLGLKKRPKIFKL
ncbi:hypothetical protein BpHYR1_001792 [Brachionus plicatilis]|uniref:Uncharacterized protein n=1 Tax=Brachionus plicatilis TaxID=10195 RepID=A0A3M7RL19_BRAPC|nr:hypothetical protein BpHYR1_001792 [Brachionus plicatilis]